MTRVATGIVAALLLLVVVWTGTWTAAVAVQLAPGERPGICGRACYGTSQGVTGMDGGQ